MDQWIIDKVHQPISDWVMQKYEKTCYAIGGQIAISMLAQGVLSFLLMLFNPVAGHIVLGVFTSFMVLIGMSFISIAALGWSVVADKAYWKTARPFGPVLTYTSRNNRYGWTFNLAFTIILAVWIGGPLSYINVLFTFCKLNVLYFLVCLPRPPARQSEVEYNKDLVHAS